MRATTLRIRNAESEPEALPRFASNYANIWHIIRRVLQKGISENANMQNLFTTSSSSRYILYVHSISVPVSISFWVNFCLGVVLPAHGSSCSVICFWSVEHSFGSWVPEMKRRRRWGGEWEEWVCAWHHLDLPLAFLAACKARESALLKWYMYVCTHSLSMYI